MTHAHGNIGPRLAARRQVRMLLAIIVVPFLLATVAGLVLLWPTHSTVSVPESLAQPRRAEAVVLTTKLGPCPGLEDQSPDCLLSTARLQTGRNRGETVDIEQTGNPSLLKLTPGDRVLLAELPDGPGVGWYFEDYARRRPLLLLAAVFAAAVLLLGRWRGLFALVALAFSLVVLIRFMLPSILEGHDPVVVALVGSAAIMFVALYLSHGFNVRTTSAVAGTLISLVITGLLAGGFVHITHLTGLGSEEGEFLRVLAGNIDLEGLLLGGIVVGSLGVLDDVTITQASAVWELSVANQAYGARQLYDAALRIGRDHIASTVNTLVLAYAGASLPLLVLFTLSSQRLGDVLSGELVAQEIVRTLVGSIGLVASVPITTAITAFVATRHRHPDQPATTRASPREYPG
jgi:uncharacterized membrane protein